MSEQIVLVGNPNAGKSTLFNLLTGLKQKVGNFSGVTVEKKIGTVEINGKTTQIVDLPGVYSLVPQQQTSEDELVTLRYLAERKPALVVNVVDATSIERHLYLSMQLRELGLPMLVVLSKLDVAKKLGLVVDINKLSDLLKCPVTAVTGADKGTLISTIEHEVDIHCEPFIIGYEPEIEAYLASSGSENRFLATKKIIDAQYQGEPLIEEDAELFIASARYACCNRIVNEVVKEPDATSASVTDKIDNWVLNTWIAIPLFLAAMYLMFTFAIHIGGAFIDFFDIAVGAILVDGVGSALRSLGIPELIVVVIADGVGTGVQTVSTFIPLIFCLYLFLTALEQSGYLARAACVTDRMMQKIGLPGSAFVPMMMGFGCTVPAVMATRTLKQKRERILSGAMSHFMSCGARLPVYALFAAAFFPDNGQNLVFLLYIIGIVAAVLTGLLFRHTVLKGDSSAYIFELPHYQWPSLREMGLRTWQRLKGFVFGAGKTIVVVVTFLSVLNSVGTDGSVGNENSEKSLLSATSQWVTPLFTPIGLKEDNWEATVGIVTGIFAKEVVVGTLNSLYQGEEEGEEATIAESLTEAVQTIGDNFADIGAALVDPLGLDVGEVSSLESAAEEQEIEVSTITRLAAKFDGQIGAFAYLLFVLMYVPCASAMGAMVREYGPRWSALIAIWTTMAGYCSATLFYQLAKVGNGGSVGIVAAVIAVLIGFFLLLKSRVAEQWLQGGIKAPDYAKAA
ncbi:ferrous iron transport protein B [Corallincola platygyrae]|uniref:Ferrous iron transport protein B n=1 Tax=Corallincola platygyrae TaxID=1193278 RepID=A0ABW4XMB1_9GAMM